MHVVLLSRPFSIFHKSISNEDEEEEEDVMENEGVMIPEGIDVIEQ